MANAFKPITSNDVAVTRTLLHEAIPLSGTIISGTYNEAVTADSNIKNYASGLFQSVYDYPYLSSSANHVFDITFGYNANSTLSASDSSTVVQQDKKINIYNEMAQVLMGHDATGSIKEFKIPGGEYIREAYFMSFARLLNKDEISKNNFSLKLDGLDGAEGAWARPGTQMKPDTITLPTSDNETVFYTDSPAGEYSILSSSQSGSVGLLFYQAGMAVLGTGSIYSMTGAAATSVQQTLLNIMTGSSISGSADALRHQINTIDFNNTTELNSTIYFCRANHNEFNYSSNPTYLSASKILVKEDTMDEPISYITTVGLYSPDNELLAVAKISEPLKKTPTTELTLRVRLDY
jgi:hypothetical protein